jgi:hypothetical protein
MVTTASVTLFKNEFVAALSDGRRIERHGWRDMAHALFSAGVQDKGVAYDWRSGQRMITAGQQVALKAEMRRLAHTAGNHMVAA